MVSFLRPVRHQDLFATVEMRLRHPAEEEVHRYGVDEGEGSGFDNMLRDAVAERVFVFGCRPAVLLCWYENQFRGLQWPPPAMSSLEVRMFRRAQEHVQVQVLPEATQLWLEERHRRSGPFGRVVYVVDGDPRWHTAGT